ncbi:MAG: lysine 2,3-aminomutase [Calditrichaeota bacterium]|nr:MAG: lysine 2,3-aminomutase [Calditrichota bacterium]
MKFGMFDNDVPAYKSYSLHNFRRIPQIQHLSPQMQFDIEVVGQVFPFKTNSYVINELIRWEDVPNDPLFILTFPQRHMLKPHHYNRIAHLLETGAPKSEIAAAVRKIRLQLNPHPAGQLQHNVPFLNGRRLNGLQHKYPETVLFFPSQGQTCHAYCSFCFRWPQFVDMAGFKFASKEAATLVAYLERHREVTDVLFTGGDPMIMSTRLLKHYLMALLEADLPHLKSIRIGTKSLSFWPYKYLLGEEADRTLALFKRVIRAGKHLALMAHFSHPRELSTPAVRAAIRRIRATGAEIRTQSPLLRHINDCPETWAKMWQKQVELGCIPYYMFVVRDTGAQHYFGVPLVEAWQIFKQAYQRVSGLARTVRGPSMSATPGKIQVMGVSRINGQKVLVLNMIQARHPENVMQPFFAKYDEKAIWIDELEPAFPGDDNLFRRILR